MDRPDGYETCSTSAPVLFCRGSRWLQAAPPSSLVHDRVVRNHAFTSRRVSADDTRATPLIRIICLRPVRSGKREFRGTHCALHTIRILCSCRTLGGILCEHGGAGHRLSLPDPSPAILEIALNSKILRDVLSFSCALPNASLDLGPHCHSEPRV